MVGRRSRSVYDVKDEIKNKVFKLVKRWHERRKSDPEMREEMSKEFFYIKIYSKEKKERMKIRGSLNKDKDTCEKALEAASSDIVSFW